MIKGITNYAGAWCLKHPELNIGGKRNKMIGRGTFARVYESKYRARVLKVTTDYYAYAVHTDGVAALRGKWFPKVYRDFGVIGTLNGREVYMVEVERLKPAWLSHDNWPMIPKAVSTRVLEFTMLFGGECIEDLHPKNIMRRRGTGDLVVCDPVCDTQQLDNSGCAMWETSW